MIADALKIAKTMKRPIIHINPNYMIGTDENYFICSVIEISSDIPRSFTCKTTDLIVPDKVADVRNKNTSFFDNNYECVGEGYYQLSYDEDIMYNNIMNTYRSINTILSVNPSKVIDNLLLTDDALENFRRLATAKVSDGHHWWVLQQPYQMSIFSSLYPINAADQVSCTIYDIDPYSFLSEISVIKKKYTIKNYVRYRKLN